MKTTAFFIEKANNGYILTTNDTKYVFDELNDVLEFIRDYKEE